MKELQNLTVLVVSLSTNDCMQLTAGFPRISVIVVIDVSMGQTAKPQSE